MIIQKETFEDMKARHAIEIKSLQENCEHEEVSDWVQSMWAPGHYGPNVRVCSICGLVVETQQMNIVLED